MKIKAILFDIDGTVYSNNLMHLYTAPLFFRYAQLLLLFQKTRKKLHCAPPVKNGKEFKARQAHLLASLSGGRWSPEQAQSQLEAFIADWENIFDKIKPYKGLKETLHAFRAAGLKTGLFSDFPLNRKIERLGLGGLWDAALSAEDVGALKPADRGFKAAAAALKAAAAETLFIGNNYQYDILGAKGAGMRAAHLKFGPPVKNSAADFTFYCYKDLKKQVFSWLKRG